MTDTTDVRECAGSEDSESGPHGSGCPRRTSRDISVDCEVCGVGSGFNCLYPVECRSTKN